jgi:hypothetical protein
MQPSVHEKRSVRKNNGRCKKKSLLSLIMQPSGISLMTRVYMATIENSDNFMAPKR